MATPLELARARLALEEEENAKQQQQESSVSDKLWQGAKGFIPSTASGLWGMVNGMVDLNTYKTMWQAALGLPHSEDLQSLLYRATGMDIRPDYAMGPQDIGTQYGQVADQLVQGMYGPISSPQAALDTWATNPGYVS